MADNRIAGLNAISDINPALDFLPIVDVSDNQMAGSGTTKKITISQILGAGGNVVLPQGTAAAPAASFTGDGNTGIFSTGADIFGISVGGVTSATFSNTGLLVAGTVSGTQLISTVATGTAPLSITSTTLVTNLNADRVDGQDASYFLNTSSQVQTKSGALYVTDAFATINSYGNFAAFQTAGGIGYRWTLNNDASFRLQHTTDGFSTVGNPRIHVSSAGQIGIGVAPSGQGGGGSIQMADSSAIISQGKNFSIVTNGYFDTSWKCYANGNFTQYYASDGKHIWWNGSGTTTALTPVQAMTLDASGNLGVGIAAPNYKLEVVGATDTAGISLTTAYGAAAEKYAALRFTNSSFIGGHSEIRNVVNGSASLGSSLTFWTAAADTGNIAERIRITSDGKVGVGTASPAASLQVGARSSSALANNSSIFTAGGASASAGTTVAATFANTVAAAVGNEAQITFTPASNYSAVGAIGVAIDSIASGSSSTKLYTYDGTSLTERLKIAGNGVCTWSNVGGVAGTAMTLNGTGLGIGTATPQAKLSVETSGIQNTISPVITAQSTGTTYAGMYSVRDGAGDQRGLVWQVYTVNVGLGEKMRLDSSGNLGLGVTPDTKLHLSGTGNQELKIQTNTSGNPIISLVAAGQDSAAILYNRTSNHLQFNISAQTGALILNTSGNLGIGVTPSAWKANHKAIQFGPYSGSYGTLYVDDSGNSWFGELFYQGASNRIYTGTGNAAAYRLTTTGQHQWYTDSVGGIANGTVSLTQSMTLDASGNLCVGQTSSSSKVTIQTGNAGNDLGISNSNLPLYLKTYGGTTESVRNIVVGHVYINSNTNFSSPQITLISANNISAQSAAIALTSTNALAFYTNGANPSADSVVGTERLRIDSNGYLYTAANGRIGIGVVPTDSLDVNGGIKLSGGSSGRYINFSNTGINGTYPRLAASLKYSTASFAGASLIESYITGLYDDRNDLRFYTFGGNERLRIDIDGNIGIGTSSPVARLQVETQGASTLSSVLAKQGGGDNDFKLVARNGNGGVAGNVESARFGLEYQPLSASGTFNSGIRFFRGGGASDGYMIFATSGVDRLTFTSAGVAQFASNISMNSGYQFQSTDGTVSLPGFSFSADTNTGIYRPTTDSIGLVTNGAERFRADASGNVIVNTAALATNATSGFLWIPSCAGTPTGAPTAPYTNAAALVWDRTNKKLYVYDGSWNQTIPPV